MAKQKEDNFSMTKLMVIMTENKVRNLNEFSSKRLKGLSGGGRGLAAPTGDPRPSLARGSMIKWS